MPNQDYEFPCHGFHSLYYFLIKGGGIKIFWRKVTAGHLVTYHTDSHYCSTLQCRAVGCLDAGTSSQSCQDKQDDEHNVMHSLPNFTSRKPVAAMAIP